MPQGLGLTKKELQHKLFTQKKYITMFSTDTAMYKLANIFLQYTITFLLHCFIDCLRGLGQTSNFRSQVELNANELRLMRSSTFDPGLRRCLLPCN